MTPPSCTWDQGSKGTHHGNAAADSRVSRLQRRLAAARDPNPTQTQEGTLYKMTSELVPGFRFGDDYRRTLGGQSRGGWGSGEGSACPYSCARRHAMTRERSMAASALGGGRGAAVGGAGARRRRRGGAVVVGRGSCEAATRIIGRQTELQIRVTGSLLALLLMLRGVVVVLD